MIQQSIEALTAQIDELQDGAQLQAGRALDLQLARTDLVALAQRVVLQYEDSIAWPAVSRSRARRPRCMENWDQMRLERALANLLSNAVKYSPSNSDIHVRVASRWPGCGAVGRGPRHGYSHRRCAAHFRALPARQQCQRRVRVDQVSDSQASGRSSSNTVEPSACVAWRDRAQRS